MVKYLLLFMLFSSPVYGEWSNEEICNAIWHAEGGTKSSVPYGIMSVKCIGGENGGCRKVCLRTIESIRSRYEEYIRTYEQGSDLHKLSFIQLVQSVYCPTLGDITEKERELNGNFYKNLMWFLVNPKPIE